MYTVKLAKIIFLLILYHRGINATATFRIMQYVLPTNLHALVLLIPKGIENNTGLCKILWGLNKLHHDGKRERRKLVSLALFGRENI